MMKKNLKVIDDDADKLYKKFKSLQVAADRAKAELMEYMAIAARGSHFFFLFFCQGRDLRYDRSQVALYGAKYSDPSDETSELESNM